MYCPAQNDLTTWPYNDLIARTLVDHTKQFCPEVYTIIVDLLSEIYKIILDLLSEIYKIIIDYQICFHFLLASIC